MVSERSMFLWQACWCTGEIGLVHTMYVRHPWLRPACSLSLCPLQRPQHPRGAPMNGCMYDSREVWMQRAEPERRQQAANGAASPFGPSPVRPGPPGAVEICSPRRAARGPRVAPGARLGSVIGANQWRRAVIGSGAAVRLAAWPRCPGEKGGQANQTNKHNTALPWTASCRLAGPGSLRTREP